jgi:hypothetical protein
MAEISFVKLDLAELAMEYADMGGGMASDEEVALWARVLIKALVARDPDAHPFAAKLLGEAEDFRRAEAERKRRAREDREAAEDARRVSARKGGTVSKDSAESTERAHRSDQIRTTNKKENIPDSSESQESAESADMLAGEHQAGPNTGSQTPKGTRPKRGTGETPKTPKEEKNVIPPTLEMVARYCENRKNGIDPMKLLAHYAKTDWKIRGSKITNWQACVVTWEKNKADFKAQGGHRDGAEQMGPLV